MKKYVLIFFIFFSCSVFSLEVNRDFIEIDLDLTVEFENYVGPYLFYNSIEDIRLIGSVLAEGITPGIKSDANYSDKYLLAHRPKLEWENVKNSCDIFEITSKSLIDNVNNIELIISQYLMDNYGYSLNDSDLLAHLLVIYNAVNRGNPQHFSEYYTTEGVVTETPEFIGLDLQYQNWPGKTFIYIPLSDQISLGNLTNIDSDLLIESGVIESIKINDEEGIKIREEIIDYKEREFDEISTELEVVKIEIENLKEEDNKEENIILIEEKVKEVSQIADDLKEKEEQILELRDDLSEDKNRLIVVDQNKSVGNLYTFILNRVIDQKKHGQIVRITNTGNVTLRSSVNSIRNSKFITVGEYIYIIAGGDSNNQFVTLGRINNETLSLINWAEVPCYEYTSIILKDKKLYTIIKYEDENYVGEFDQELKLLRRSPVSLVEESYMLLKDDTFYIQGKYNSIKLVNLSDFITITD